MRGFTVPTPPVRPGWKTDHSCRQHPGMAVYEYDDDGEEVELVQAHCKQDGWVFIGSCPHCSPSCACGKYCTGPYLVGLDDNNQPVYSPFMTVLSGGEED